MDRPRVTNTPLAIVDLPGGGGKRDIHSFEHYDRTTGISVYRSPAVHAELAYSLLIQSTCCRRKVRNAGRVPPNTSG